MISVETNKERYRRLDIRQADGIQSDGLRSWIFFTIKFY